MNTSDPENSSLPMTVVYRATRGLFFAIFGGFALGFAVDRVLHIAPWCALAGISIGTFVGFYRLIRAAKFGLVR
jgi:F0F1-type ATP synthase assembly protein I